MRSVLRTGCRRKTLLALVVLRPRPSAVFQTFLQRSSNIQHPTSNLQHPTSFQGHSGRVQLWGAAVTAADLRPLCSYTATLGFFCRTIADECCFGAPPSPGVVNYQLHEWVERDLCGSTPWLVLHKVRISGQIRFRV